MGGRGLLAVLFLVGSRQNPFSWHLPLLLASLLVSLLPGAMDVCVLSLLAVVIYYSNLVVYYYLPLPYGALPRLHQP